MKSLFFAILFALSTTGYAQSVASSPLMSPADWERLASRTTETEHRLEYEPKSLSGNSWLFYNLAYAIDGNTAMFEATGMAGYLERALNYAENCVRTATLSRDIPQSQYKDGFKGWPALQHPVDKSIRGGEYPLFESYCWRYVTRLLRVVRESPEAWADANMRDRYDSLLAFTERHIFDKWIERGSSNVYRSHTHMASHWAYIALELSFLTEDKSRKADCVKVYEQINRGLPNYKASLRSQLVPHPLDNKAFFWASEWSSTDRPGQDVAHGNNVIAYVVDAHDLGVEFTTEDIAAFCRLVELIWQHGQQRDTFAQYVDGSGAGNGWFNDGFMKLGRYDASIQLRIQSHNIGRGIQFFGNAALNASRLRPAKPRIQAPN